MAPRTLPYLLVAEWHRDEGWGSARITRMAPWRLSPFTGVLHYAQAIFEGLKARWTARGQLAIFRPQAHAERFMKSARRMAMPPLPVEDFCACVAGFTRHQRAQFSPGEALYLRPLLFASEEMLGARPASHFTFAVMGAVIGEPADPGKIGVYIDPRYTRSAPGGTGAAKTAGNYAASLLPQAEAAERGFQQVLFLDARERLYLEETGATNVMFRAGNQLLTPPLGDTILDGVTRRSIMALAPGLGFEVVERPLHWRETLADVAAGRISEAFGLGTGAGVLPFKCIGTAEQTLPLASDEAASQLRAVLRAEQLGQGQQPWLDYVG